MRRDDAGRPYFVMELVRGIKINRLLRSEQSPHARTARLVIRFASHPARSSKGISTATKPSNILSRCTTAVPCEDH